MSSQVSTASVHLNTEVIENWRINSACSFSPLPNGAGDPVENDMENAEVLKTFFTSAFTSEPGLWESQAPETTGKTWIREDLPLVEEDQALKLDRCRFTEA